MHGGDGSRIGDLRRYLDGDFGCFCHEEYARYTSHKLLMSVTSDVLISIHGSYWDNPVWNTGTSCFRGVSMD
jgi:hypothetical protein